MHDFLNLTANPRLAAVCDSVSASFVEYFSAKKVVCHRVAGFPDTTRIMDPDQAIVFGTILQNTKGLFLSARIRLGLDKSTKEVAYDPKDDVVRNVSPAIDALFSVYERKYFSNVQIFTQPDSALLCIDGDTVGVSPWEANMLRGAHSLHILRNGFKPIDDKIIVSPSDNKFRFEMAEQRAEPTRQPLVTAASPPPARKAAHVGRWLLLGGAVACAGGAGFAHASYLQTVDQYHQPGLTLGEYDARVNKGRFYLYSRNGAAAASLVLAGAFVLEYL